MELNVEDTKAKLADAVNSVTRGGERVVLKRKGRKVAAIVTFEELKRLEKWEDEQDLKAARKAAREKGGITLEELKRKYGIGQK